MFVLVLKINTTIDKPWPVSFAIINFTIDDIFLMANCIFKIFKTLKLIKWYKKHFLENVQREITRSIYHKDVFETKFDALN